LLALEKNTTGTALLEEAVIRALKENKKLSSTYYIPHGVTNFDMVSCPRGGAEFPPKDMWTEAFQAEESGTGNVLNEYVIFNCPYSSI
jgi:hypothetical protein